MIGTPTASKLPMTEYESVDAIEFRQMLAESVCVQ